MLIRGTQPRSRTCTDQQGWSSSENLPPLLSDLTGSELRGNESCGERLSATMARLLTAHFVLCSPVSNRPQTSTDPWPGAWGFQRISNRDDLKHTKSCHRLYANTTPLYIRGHRILRFSHPSLKPIPADTKGTTKGQLYRFHKIWATQRPHVWHSGRCSEQLQQEQGTPRPWTGKKPNVISNRSLQMQVPRAEVAAGRSWSSHRLHLGALRPRQADVCLNLTRVSGAPRMIPQPAADKLCRPAAQKRSTFFLLAWSLLHNQVGAPASS